MLGAQRKIHHKELSMVSERAGEAGGVLSYVMSSGVEVVGYLADISMGASPIGIQIHNVEHMDEGYMYDPWRERGVRRVSKPGEVVAISAHCEVDTNFIHPNAQPHSGKRAYLAPSGLITDDPGLGGPQIGNFMSSLNDRDVAGLPHSQLMITVYGGGFVRGSYMQKVGRGRFEVQEPTIEFVQLQSPGWARVRINM